MAERSVLLKNVCHPFLVGLRYSFQTPEKLYFVLDYVNGGEVGIGPPGAFPARPSAGASHPTCSWCPRFWNNLPSSLQQTHSAAEKIRGSGR